MTRRLAPWFLAALVAALLAAAAAAQVAPAAAPDPGPPGDGGEAQAPPTPGPPVPPTLPAPTTAPVAESSNYDNWFTDEALRVELYHWGGARDDQYLFDRAVREPLWPGMRKVLLDVTGYGKYRFRVQDLASGTTIFSQGFCTLFGEWQATPEALELKQRRTFEESVRFPFPKAPVRLILDRRQDVPGPDGRGSFQEVFRLDLDPASHLVARDPLDDRYPLLTLHESGDPRERIDILILGDGYTAGEMEKYRRDARRFAAVLLGDAAFAPHHGLVNVWGLEAPSRDSGPDEPRKGLFRDTVVGTTFNTFDSERYLTTAHDRALRETAAHVPYDALYILVNTSRYGGGGIYNQWAIFPSDNEYDNYVFLHEFGHSFAGLADEYYDSGTSFDDAFYPAGVEPWEPNISAMLPGRPLKWEKLVAAGTPIPTPDDEAHAAVVGAFEGAGYKAKGLYRPYRDCRMFHKGLVPFCPVCAASFETVIRLYTE
ncbi:MAG: peptidase M64 [Deltaproteobacteria bacterium]|nr:peptidase M64 [Deltaproteobacteria bacterium]